MIIRIFSKSTPVSSSNIYYIVKLWDPIILVTHHLPSRKFLILLGICMPLIMSCCRCRTHTHFLEKTNLRRILSKCLQLSLGIEIETEPNKNWTVDLCCKTSGAISGSMFFNPWNSLASLRVFLVLSKIEPTAAWCLDYLLAPKGLQFWCWKMLPNPLMCITNIIKTTLKINALAITQSLLALVIEYKRRTMFIFLWNRRLIIFILRNMS